jgi:hypothetical protein
MVQFRAKSVKGSLPTPSSPDDDEGVTDPITNFKTSMNALFDYALRNVADRDMVGLVIQHENSEGISRKNKPIGFSFRRKDQLSL